MKGKRKERTVVLATGKCRRSSGKRKPNTEYDYMNISGKNVDV